VPEGLGKKDDYLKWRGLESTTHLLFTGAEGVNADIRCNAKTNPIRRLHAIIADYDSNITEAMDESVLLNAPAGLRPNWLTKTYSGHRRLVWLFEEPVAFDSILSKRFFGIAHRELRMEKLLPGLDPLYSNPTQIYDVGAAWQCLNEQPLSKSVLNLWLFEASKQTDWSKLGELKIPIDAVAEEIEKQFPGQWTGAFQIGARGAVFWEGKSNPTSAIVTESGMIAFSSHKLFHSWADILGAAFVRKFQADKIGGAVSGTYFDGRSYYRKIDKAWMSMAKEDFQKTLRVDHSLDSSRGKNESASEVDRAEVFVQKHRRVSGIVPRVFDPRDVIDINGQKFLNSAYVRAVEPADEPQEWGTRFPWLAEFFDTCFDSLEQKDYFLAWHKRFYCSALAGDLLKGQNIFIVGGVNRGKTLLSNLIVGGSVGGFADASDFVTKGSEWNRNLADVGLWTVDDGSVASDPVAHRKFAELVKRLSANPTLNVRAMYRDPQTASWSGRLCVTLNEDPASLQMLPDLEISMSEKVMVFKFSDSERVFPPKHVLEPTIAAELTYYGRWLCDWTVPEALVGDHRFGVRSFLHEQVRAKAMHSGRVGEILELVSMLIKTLPPEEGDWIGTSSGFYTQAARDDVLKPLVSKYSPRVIGKLFSEASRIADSGITLVEEDRKRGNTFRIAKPERADGKPVRVKPDVSG
jgi:hypothetical protein